jgi:hypothetical protein
VEAAERLLRSHIRRIRHLLIERFGNRQHAYLHDGERQQPTQGKENRGLAELSSGLRRDGQLSERQRA